MKNLKNKIAETLKQATKASQRNYRIENCGGAVKATTQVHKDAKAYTRKYKHKVMTY